MTARPRSEDRAKAILQAAHRCLSQKGYAAATIAEIAAEAGVSRGLLHYYYASKEQLLAQVVRAGTEAYLELLETVFARSDSAEDLAKQLVMATRTIVESDPTFVNLSMECWTLAHESPLVARELEDLYHHLRDAVSKGLREATNRGIIRPAIALEPLAALLLAITDGLVMQCLIHRALAADESVWTSLEMAARALLGDEA
jgi:AcrR family transcriptional regulator